MKTTTEITTDTKSICRLFRILSVLCLCALLFSGQKAGASIFAPTEAELDAAIQQSPQSVPDVRALPHLTIDGKTYVKVGDMLLRTKQVDGIESAFGGNAWTNGIVYYQFDSDVSAQNRQNWRNAAAEWASAVPALSFAESVGSGNFYIQIHNSTGNLAAIGMQGPAQLMNIVSWGSRFIIAHEIGHALGLFHEQQRSDRNSFVQINLANVQSGQAPNFNIPNPPPANYGTYDFDSVMHYDKCAFSIDCPPGSSCSCANYTITVPPPNQGWQNLIGQRDHLSELDKAGMAQRYGGCTHNVLSETFDGVAVPTLPSGWLATNSSVGIPDSTKWATSSVTPDSFPNDAFLPDQNGISDKYLTTPSVTISSTSAQVSFRNNFDTEVSGGTFWDGGVLEISINGGSFTDILDAGGSFVSGGYTGRISTAAQNPLSNRLAWSGNSGGYINTVANLGPNVNGQTIKLRWRMGTDLFTTAPGWRVDTISVTESCTTPTPTPTPPPGGLVITNTNSQGVGSLASAIASANTNPLAKTISFSLPGSGPWTITITSTLTVTAPVWINGTPQASQANRVYLEGAPGVANVFEVRNHGGTTISGLGIYNYDSTGVLIDNANGTQIENCYIGFKQTGGAVLLNRLRAPFSTGISIRGSLNQVHRSTISGVYNGITVGEPNEQVTGFVSADNLFEGNNIGTDPTGQTTNGYGNTLNGISLRAGAKSSWTGGFTFPEPSGFNVIAGNGGSGILISHPTADHNRVFSNYLGLNRGGTAVITGGTNQQGILIENGAQYNAAWSNFISGNRSAGIMVASSNNWILGNIMGLTQTQAQSLGGQPYGVLVKVDTLNTPGAVPRGNAIGGSDPNPPYYSYGNVICNQSVNGIEIQDGVSNGAMCNWIGFNTSGQPFPNGGWGVNLLNSSYNSDYGCRNAWGPNGFGRVGGSGGCCNSIQ